MEPGRGPSHLGAAARGRGSAHLGFADLNAVSAMSPQADPGTFERMGTHSGL